MVAGDLITRLLDIDKAIAFGDYQQARALIAEMEDQVLDLERSLIDALRELSTLRSHMESLTTSTLRRRFLSRLNPRERSAPRPDAGERLLTVNSEKAALPQD